MMILSEQKVPTDTLLNAMIADRLNILVWMKTKDGSKGRNRPKSIVDALTGAEEQKTRNALENATVFDSVEDLKEALKKSRRRKEE